MTRFCPVAVALVLLVGCQGFGQRGIELVFVGPIITELGADSEGIMGEYARADATEQRRMAATNGVATALHVIQDLEAYSASQSFTEIAEAFLGQGRRAEAGLALEMALAAILAYDTGGGCRDGPLGAMCRLREPVGPAFNRRWGIARVAVVAAKNGFDDIVDGALAATDEPETLAEKVAGIREDLLARQDAEPRPPPDLDTEPPENLEARLQSALALAEVGREEQALAWVRGSLPEIRAVMEPARRSSRLVEAAEALLAAGEREEAIALALEAVANPEASAGGQWWSQFSAAVFLKKAGEGEEAERAADGAVLLAQETEPTSDDSWGYSLLAQSQRQRAYSLWTNGFYRQAIVLSRAANDHMYSKMGYVGAAMAIWADQELSGEEKSALYNQILEIVDPLPREPSPKWRAGAERDPLLAAMFVASAIGDAQTRRQAFRGILNQALHDERNGLVSAIMGELDNLEPALGSPFQGYSSMRREYLLAGGEHRRRALAHLEAAANAASEIADPEERIDQFLWLTRDFKTAGMAVEATAMLEMVMRVALDDDSRDRDELLGRAIGGLAGEGAIEDAEALAEMIRSPSDKEVALVLVALGKEEAGDTTPAMALYPLLKGLDQRFTLLAALGSRTAAKGDDPGLAWAVERIEAFLEEPGNLGKMELRDHLSLANLYLAQGNTEQAVLNYERAAALAPRPRDALGPWDFLSLAELAKDLEMAAERKANMDKAWASSPGYQEDYVVAFALWSDLYREALDGALRPREGKKGDRDQMLEELADVADSLAAADELSQEEIEAMLAEILDAVG
ncbi:hypothetical protein IIA16_00385 [bacterium]|nr:hypothetical protein [bacterium]